MDEYREPGNIFEQKKGYEDLQSSPAFIKLIGEIQAQVDGLQQEILFGPVRTQEDLFFRERQKGMLEGRLSITNTLTTLVETLQVDYNTAVAEKENNDEE